MGDTALMGGRTGRRMRARTIAGAWRELIAAELALDGIAPDGTALGGRRRDVAEARVRRAEHEYRLAHSA